MYTVKCMQSIKYMMCRTVLVAITWQVTSSASAQFRSYMYSSVAQLVVVDLDNSDQLAFLQLFICGLHGFQLASVAMYAWLPSCHLAIASFHSYPTWIAYGYHAWGEVVFANHFRWNKDWLPILRERKVKYVYCTYFVGTQKLTNVTLIAVTMHDSVL